MDPNEAADLLAAKLKSAPPPADTERAVDDIEEIDDGDATIVDMFDLGKTRERPKA
jgi:hypothetical protein